MNNLHSFSTNIKVGEMMASGSFFHHNPVSTSSCKEIWQHLTLLLGNSHQYKIPPIPFLVPSLCHSHQSARHQLSKRQPVAPCCKAVLAIWLQSNTRLAPICGEGSWVFAPCLSAVGTAGRVQSHKLVGKGAQRNGQELSRQRRDMF